MRKILLLIGILSIVIACNEKRSNEGLLTVSLENVPDNTILNIIDYDNGKILSKIPVFNNKFEYAFNFTTPRLIGICEDNPKYPKDRKLVWLENSNINIKGNYDYFANAKVEGSASNIINEQFVSLVRKFEFRLYNLNLSMRIEDNQNVKDSISVVIEQVTSEYKEKKIQLYLKNIETYVVLYNLLYETADYYSVLDKNDLEKLFDKLPDKLKSSKKGDLLKVYISLPEKPKVGEKFIDFSQLTPDCKEESISTNLAKYTIIEFWASSCGPCRAEHPRLRKLYSQYHDKGLNIIGISGDEGSVNWTSAIRQDTLPWINISDLGGWNNKAFMIYGVKSIPHLILLDKNGVIIFDDFERRHMESELKKLFK